MGEAKRRSAEIAAMKERVNNWRVTLTAEEKFICDLAERIDERLVRGRSFTEGCYNLSFFMADYCARAGINVDPVVGFVNDGSWPGMTSHAWIEYQGKKTDTSLTLTSNSKAQPSGGLLVHDFLLTKGVAAYTYHRDDSAAAKEGIEWMRGDPELASVWVRKLAEHKFMYDIAQNRDFARYFDAAPPQVRYDALARIIE